MDQSNRRGVTRIKTAFEVVNAVPPIEGLGYLSDVSADGAHLECPETQPALGQSIHLSVRLAKDRPPLVLFGEVIRHTEQGFAVRFDKPCAELAPLFREEPDLGPAAGVPARAGVSAFREVLVDACASSQWMAGRICTPPKRPLLDHLNQDDRFVRFIDTVVPHQPDPLPFLALRAQALELVVPVPGQEEIENRQRVGNYLTREVKLLLPYAIIDGTIDVLGKIRVSDHLMRCGAFLAIHDCRVTLARKHRPARDVTRAPVLLVNTHRVLGISDMAAATAPEEDPDA